VANRDDEQGIERTYEAQLSGYSDRRGGIDLWAEVEKTSLEAVGGLKNGIMPWRAMVGAIGCKGVAHMPDPVMC
jgi:hypothetical protein